MIRFHFKNPKEDEDFFNNISKVRDSYDSLFGEGSFSEDIDRMWNSLESKRVWHEVRRKKLSSPF